MILQPFLRPKAVILYLYSFTQALFPEDLLGFTVSPTDRHLLQQVELPGLSPGYIVENPNLIVGSTLPSGVGLARDE